MLATHDFISAHTDATSRTARLRRWALWLGGVTVLLVVAGCAGSTTDTTGSETDTVADVDDPNLDAKADAQADAADVLKNDVTGDTVDVVTPADVADAADAQDTNDVEDAEDAPDSTTPLDIVIPPDVAPDAEDTLAPEDAADAVDVQTPVDIVVPSDVWVDDVPVGVDAVLVDDTGAVDDVVEVDATDVDSGVTDQDVAVADVPVIEDTQVDDAQADVAGGTDAVASDVQTQDAPDIAQDVYISPWEPICFTCHGNKVQDNPAPPKDLQGKTDPALATIGAHQSHLKAADWRHEITCQQCHPVPDPYAPTHFNGQVDLVWGDLAKTGTFDFTSLSCNAVYCHGGSLPANGSGTEPNKQPVWNVLDGSQESCGQACHSTPPGGKHPADQACQNCHGEVIASFDPATKTAVWANGSLHVDGLLEVGNLNCTSCHGNAANQDPAPPKGTKGELLTSEAAVGAHQKHLTASDWHKQVVCTDCHAVPASTAHANGVFDFAFSALASAAGASPKFDASTVTCSSVYCHGSSTGNPKVGGTVKHEPIWNQVDGTFESCGASCHTNPPAEPHPQNQDCAMCHGAVIASFTPATNTATWANPSAHVDGIVDVIGLTCTTCHGNPLATNAAPPKGTKGEQLTTDAAVGAHQKHLGASDWHRAGQCTDCHTVPESTGHANGVLDLAWGLLAGADGAKPTFDPATVTCNAVYCHGTTLPAAKAGGTLAQTPKWTQVDGSFESCGASCHTNPPGGKHPQNLACEKCHGDVIASYNDATKVTTWAKPELHINGNVDVVGLNCTSCHGDAVTNNPAPPKGSKGELLTTDHAVGAHQQHLGQSDWHRAGQCTDCHVVPASTGHSNGQADLAWGGVATSSNATPVYSAANATCSSVYCHGGTLQGPKSGGAVKNDPVWTQVDGTYDSCGASCHTNPPGGTHPQSTKCTNCHTPVIASFDPVTQQATWANADLHVNGTVETAGLTCTSCHGDAGTNNPAPPKGPNGETLTTAPAVGAHQQHLGTSDWHRAGQCADCHVVPESTLHTNGVVDLAFGALALAGGSVASFDVGTLTCNAVYCHGNTLPAANAGGATKKSPQWTQVDGTYDSCGASCHTNPPGGSHPKSTACATCHTDVIASFNPATQTATWTDPTRHINGTIDVKTLTCTTCHGDALKNDPAPPLGTHGEQLTTSPAVGAHQKHLGTSDWHRNVQCTDCHTVPESVAHSNGVFDFAWGGPSAAGGATPTFDPANVTCNTVYCHGTTLLGPKPGVTLKQSPIWTQVDGTFEACGTSCHSTPPGPPHAQNTQCETCHSAVIAKFTPGVGNAPPTVIWADASRHIDGVIDAPALTCTACHGDADTNNPAPPRGTKGETLTTQAAVGAHQQHLASVNWHRDVRCSDCHTVPSNTLHANGIDDVVFGALATTGGLLPTFDPATVTCNAVYCHGNSLPPAKSGGTTNKTPQWTQVDGTFNSCGASCHTNPPGGSHPKSDACGMCHTDVVTSFNPATQAVIWNNGKLHIDGKVDVKTMTCTSCHGDTASNNPAPPTGTQGETETTSRAVGAHTQHLAVSDWHRDGTCTDCHTVPVSMTHTNGQVELNWGALATAANSVATFDPVTLTCNAVYCHGNSLPAANAGGATKKSPKWTQVDGTYDSCGASCHTNPPGGTHPQSTSCPTCHAEVIDSYDAVGKTAVWTNKSLHVDGTIQVKTLTCTTCHGDAGTNNPAPPKGTKGETLTTQAAVGAHTQHLNSSTWHRNVQCTDCHVVPASTSHSNGQAELTWGGPAAVNGATPTYDAANATCNSVYCHGNTLPFGAAAGGSLKLSPKWTQVDGTYDACGQSCHTTPPGGAHAQNTACEQCHGDVISSFTPGVGGAAPTVVWKDASRHVDGIIDSPALSCTACHGDTATNDPAPPKGTKGETLTTQAAVGAHQQHQGPSTWHKEVACTECHVVPASPLHADTLVDVNFGALATAANSAASFDFQSLTCNAVYCHGNTLPAANAGGATKKTPKWTTVDGTFNACGASCHTNPPGGTHPQNTMCATCHTDVITSYDPVTQATVWADASLHIDGKVEVKTLTCTTCHGDAATNNPAPPKGTKGETATTDLAVGAHTQHLQANTWHKDVDCTDCHTVPASTTHANGTVDMTWSNLAKTGGSTPTFDAGTATCATVYCHGNTLPAANAGGATAKTPKWTQVDGTYDSCGASCHTNPPGGTHPQNLACANCHAAVITSYDPVTQSAVWTDKSLHVDGTVQVKALSCTSCHGDAGTNNPAPPKGTQGETLTTEAAVGAHAQHGGPSDWHRVVECVDCHIVPASTSHSNGQVDFGWGGPSATGGANPSFDPATVTCNAVYCHGTTLFGPNPGGTLKQQPKWTTVDGTYDKCGASCHTTPPGAPHVQNTKCETCHSAVIAKFTPGVGGAAPTVVWADASRHIDGVVDAPALTCTACHGNAATNNPAPPTGTQGETLTTEAAVGAHAQHISTSTWHRDVQCADCHVVPASTLHANGVDDVTFGALATTNGAAPEFTPATLTCNAVYCHGTTLVNGNASGTMKQAPVWTTVDGTYDSCGQACHSTPPGGTHSTATDCKMCHAAVISTFDAVTKTATWVDRTLHINGTVESNKYHDLSGWTSPKFGTNHHGSNWFIRNQMRDEHNVACTQCHGAALDGGVVNVSCNNATIACHGANAATNGTAGNWKACNFCHGNATQNNPPTGVANETATNTLGVGRHAAHLASSSTHVAFACTQCHTVPAVNDINHILGYIFSADLTTTGHHGDVAFPTPSTALNNTGAMTWTVTNTTGTPITGRGTCTGACHSNGRSAAPLVTPYWAGGTWTAGTCAGCHAATPTTGNHGAHTKSSNNVGCIACHPAATAATHMNGLRDVNTTITAPNGWTGSITTSRNATTGRVACNGTCHGQNHTPYNW